MKNSHRNVIILFIFSFLFLIILELLVGHEKVHFPMEKFHGFYGFFGFLAFVILVFGAKHILRPLVFRSDLSFKEEE